MQRIQNWNFNWFIALTLFYAISGGWLRAQENMIGDESDGSRTIPIHLIRLIDQDSSVIWLDEYPLLPFSPNKTCGACHNYAVISAGWHFNSADSGIPAGRPGHPWIYADPYTLTQIPISLRDWPGLFQPEHFGLDLFDYVAIFGRQMPGGGAAEKEELQSIQKVWRWRVSGNAEINCLSCHDAERAYDQSQYALNMLRENFRWAATASAGFASVRGMAADLPDNYDIYAGVVPDQPQKLPPQVNYQGHRFNERGELFLDITRHIPVERCYFCHSTKTIDPLRKERWQFEEDVHIKSGMLCVDCHRHGLDHQMIRGFEGETDEDDHPLASAFTCEGCHLGKDNSDFPPIQGRAGAPKPQHRGIPPVHFEKMTCTTCHSGTWPGDQTLNVKTSMAHALGLPKINKNKRALPHIISPVYAKQNNQKIAPHHLLWPSYWAEMKGDTIQPVAKEFMTPVVKAIINHKDSLGTGDWPVVADSQIVAILDSLMAGGGIKNKPVYVSAGKIYHLNNQHLLISETHQAAQPYLWPFAHDVRPAAQSLGIRGCNDCHNISSAFYFGDVEIDSPIRLASKRSIHMTSFLDQNPIAVWIFSFSFFFRPWLKYLIVFCCVIIFAVLTLYAFKGLARFMLLVSAEKEKNS